MEADYKSW